MSERSINVAGIHHRIAAKPESAMSVLSVAKPAGGLVLLAAPASTEGVVTGGPKTILRWEAAAAALTASAAYAQLGSGWALFALLFFTPDLTMLGYLGGRRIGAALYNIGHSYIAPAILGALGLAASSRHLLALALIWIAHIGFDRALGYGLKFSIGFGRTHLGSVGGSKT